MDPILAAERLPKLAEHAMRAAIVGAARDGRRVSQRRLVDDALIRFERAVGRIAVDGVRPALLFAERDKIVRELGAFAEGRLAGRLFGLHRRDLLAVGKEAAPFDAIVRGRRGAEYGVVFRRLARDGRRLETLRAMRNAARTYRGAALAGILVYDFSTSAFRTLRLGQRAVELRAA
jgi:hypothetical protein